ncbi:hypothetical protein DFH09DRAFT_1376339 [Mycena vulgaris]|nr:hypothetical protein DFH09DRAFT_1376339 [Mycena vulgaris]
MALSVNHEPHPPPTRAGSHLRSRLIGIEAKMADLESQLAFLRVEREGVLDSLHCIIYPVLTLPPEVIAEIFLHYVDIPAFRYKALRLAGVCRVWRAIALSTHALWNHFYAGISTRNPDLLSDTLRSWLPRAGSLPLNLTIYLPVWPDAVLSILAQHSSQWSSLELHSGKPIFFPIDSIRTPLSSLKKLKIAVNWPDNGPAPISAFLDAPKLREAHIDLSLARISLPWIQLTTLGLSRQSPTECLSILEQTPNLEVLTFSGVGMVTASASPRIMPHLRTVKLSNPHSTLLDHLTLPALERLELMQLAPVGCEAVKALVTRSGCSVKALHLFQTSFNEAYTCISNLPSLTEFTMRFPEWSTDEFTTLFDWITEDPNYMPALESFNIDFCGADIEIGPLVAMLSARWRGVETTAKLTSVRLSVDLRPGYSRVGRSQPAARDANVEWALEDLLALRDEGLKMDINSLPKWSTANISSQMMEKLETDIPNF